MKVRQQRSVDSAQSKTFLLGLCAIFVVIIGGYALLSQTKERHLNTEFRGVSCKSTTATSSSEYSCWHNALNSYLDKDDLTSALKQLDFFSRESPDFVQTCHTFAHLVGERAYKDFKGGKQVPYSPAMQICDFGFYHGFMTAFIFESRDYKKLGAFCTSTQQIDVSDTNIYSEYACFHGIGHGSVSNHSDEEWKKPLVLVNNALSICRIAATTQEQYRRCVGGAFNGMSYGPYGKHIDPHDVYKICRQISDKDFPDECYANLASVVFNLTPDKTIKEAIALASTQSPREYLLRAIPTFANMAARQMDSEEESTATCRALPTDEKDLCFLGYVIGLVQSSVPDTKDRLAYTFCAKGASIGVEPEMCFEDAFTELSSFWSTQKIERSCSDAPATGTEACHKALAMWLAKRNTH